MNYFSSVNANAYIYIYMYITNVAVLCAMRAIQLAQLRQLRLLYGIAHIALELLALHLAGPAQQRPRYLEYATSLTLPGVSFNFFHLPSKTFRKLKEVGRKLKETPGKLKKLVFFELPTPG